MQKLCHLLLNKFSFADIIFLKRTDCASIFSILILTKENTMRKTIFLIITMLAFVSANYAVAMTGTSEVDPASSLGYYTSFGEWNTDGDFEGWDGQWSMVQITNQAVYGGNITGTVTGVDMSIRKDFAYGSRPNLFNGDIVEIRCKYDENTKTTGGNYYFHTGAWNPLNFLTGSVHTDGQFHVYRTTITEDAGLTILCRVDMINGASDVIGETFKIDYIRYKSKVTIDPVDAAGKSLAYTSLAEWNTDNDFEGWTAKDSSNTTVSAGYLSGITTSGDPWITKNNTAGLPQIDLDENKILEIKMKREASDNGIFDVFYGTVAHPGASGTRRVELTGSSMPADGAFHVYRIDMSTEADWTGNLESLRIDTTQLSGRNYSYDYVRIGKIVPEPASLSLLILVGLAFLRKK